MKLSSKVLWSTITCPVPLTFSRGCWFPQLLQRQCVAFVMKAFSCGLSLYANYHLNRGRNQANEYLACNYWNYCLVLRSWHISRITFLSSRIRVECIRRIACYDFVCMTQNRLVAWISNYITRCNEIAYLLPNFQRCNCWSLRLDKKFHPMNYRACIGLDCSKYQVCQMFNIAEVC